MDKWCTKGMQLRVIVMRKGRVAEVDGGRVFEKFN